MTDKTMAAAITPSTLEDMLGIKVREVRSYPMKVTTTMVESLSTRIVKESVVTGGEHAVTYKVMVWDRETNDYVCSNSMDKETILGLLLDAANAIFHS